MLWSQEILVLFVSCHLWFSDSLLVNVLIPNALFFVMNSWYTFEKGLPVNLFFLHMCFYLSVVFSERVLILYNHLCHQGASRMRGRLGSMGSISSFERVSVLEGEYENSQSFAQGTLGILTFYPVAFKSLLYSSSVLRKDVMCVLSLSSMSVVGGCQQFSSHMTLRCIIPT